MLVCALFGRKLLHYVQYLETSQDKAFFETANFAGANKYRKFYANHYL